MQPDMNGGPMAYGMQQPGQMPMTSYGVPQGVNGAYTMGMGGVAMTGQGQPYPQQPGATNPNLMAT